MVGSLTQSVEATLNNPLWSDLQNNLKNEKENYDFIFNVLPENMGTFIPVFESMKIRSNEAWSGVGFYKANRGVESFGDWTIQRRARVRI